MEETTTRIPGTDLAAVNNTVVSMRGAVKASKVQVIRKLMKTVRKLRTKKATEEQKMKNLRKAQRMVDEIFAVKGMKADKLSKFALQNTATVADICEQSSASAETRMLVRICEHKFVAEKVKAFRESYENWHDLAYYLYTKPAERRFKQKKKKLQQAKKEGRVSNDLPNRGTSDEETDRDSSQQDSDEEAVNTFDQTQQHRDYKRLQGSQHTGGRSLQAKNDDSWLKGDQSSWQMEGRYGAPRGRNLDEKSSKLRGRGREGKLSERGSRSRTQNSFEKSGSKKGVRAAPRQKGARAAPKQKEVAEAVKRKAVKTAPEQKRMKEAPKQDTSHPSWEAHRKRKEMEKSASFCGKRITFDE